ncbi:MAG: hypothetical protein H6R26_3106 [Proteobacteria bacterium]|nr:hypothetical protein [Pseudomonadota bacterium]
MAEISSRGFDKGRLQSLSDGVFSIVMTLLVLQVISNEVLNANSSAELHQALLELWPKVLSYIISFAVAGVFWVAQHADLHHLRHTDDRYLWISILFLFWISLLPFSAALLGEHHQYHPHISYFIYVLMAILYILAGIIPARLRIRSLNPTEDAD